MYFAVLPVIGLLIAGGTQIDAAFADRPGVAVVLSVESGRVVAAHRPDAARETALRPGSAVKPFVLELLRERGVADARLACPGRLRIGARQLDCTHVPLNEPVDAHRALAYSCNNWFAQASRRLSADDLRQGLLRAGFQAELARDDDAKRLQALGEAGVRITPLALAMAYRKLAMRGTLTNDLEASVEFGTSQLAAPAGSSVAAKTGTTSEGAWLAGWIPAEKPKYVVVVFVAAGSGGSDAAPVARQIFAGLMPDAGENDPRGVKVRSGGAVEFLPMEEYVAGVVAGEAGSMRGTEALKAMAIAARTWAAALRGRHAKEGFDFCSTTHCQEYRPGEISQAVVAAVRATAGEMLWWQGRPASTYYGKDCGGVTEAAAAVWPELQAPYLLQHEDPWCRSGGRYEWRAELGLKQVAMALRKEGLAAPASIDSVRVVSRTASGRVARLQLGGAVVSGSSFRFAVGRQLGWNLVRSGAFEVSLAGPDMVLRGTGSGHGVGLCQVGAAHMAEQGRKAAEILAFYYPGTVLSRSAAGLKWQTFDGERVRLSTTQPDRDRAMTASADAMAAWVERRAGLRFHRLPEIRVYPTAAAFRDGAAEPGWVAGSTKGAVIRLQPGMPESVLRHELMHELVEQNAAPGLPVWFREGVALCLTGGREQGDDKTRVQNLIDRHGEKTVLSWIAGPGRPTL